MIYKDKVKVGGKNFPPFFYPIFVYHNKILLPLSTTHHHIILYKSLNYFFNLRRTTFLKSDLIVLSQQAESLHTDILKLYRAKQIILKKERNYGGILYFII